MTERLKKIGTAFKDPATLSFITMFIVWIGSMVFIPNFATAKHNITLLQTAALLGLIAIGQAIVVISGGFDMSVSSIVTLSSVVASYCIQEGYGAAVAIIAALICSIFIGAVNATCINFLRIPPIIMTIAMMSLIEGTLLVLTNGTPPSGCGDFIRELAKGTVCGVPIAALVWLVFIAAFTWMMTKSKYGRYIYAIGTNESAAKLSGVNICGIKYLAYMISGLCSGFAGIIILGSIGNTYLTIGNPYQLYSISAVVIGGIAVTGGKGKFIGVVAGTMLVFMLKDILNVMHVSAAGRELWQGIMILLVLLAYGREKANR